MVSEFIPPEIIPLVWFSCIAVTVYVFFRVFSSTLKEKFKKNVHDNFVWISPYDFSKYKILPGDHDVCFKLVNYYYNNGKKFPDYLLNKI